MGVVDRLWTSNASPIACMFHNKVMFLLMIMLIYDKPILSGQPPLSNHSQVPGGWLFDDDSTVFFIRPSSQRTCDYRTPLQSFTPLQ